MHITGGEGLRGEGGSLPGYIIQQGEADCAQSVHGLQAGGVWVRPAPRQRPLHRVRRQRLQLRQELWQVLRRLRQDPGQHDPQGAGADAAHPVGNALSVG